MKHLLTVVAALLGLASAGEHALAAGELHIYNWGNYTSPELIEKFEKAYDVEVTIDGYDSNETMLAKVKGGGTGYDIVVPGDYMAQVMIAEGLLAQTKPYEMENFKHVDARWKSVYWDPGRRYTVPWQWGSTSFSVNTAAFDGDIDTLAILFDPPDPLKGRINMLNDINDVMNAGLRYLGHPRCNTNREHLRELGQLLLSARRYWRGMDYRTTAWLKSGQVDASQIWNGMAMRARRELPSLKYAYPREGFTGWMDNVAVLKGAPNLENAKLFQNFIMDPENAALISNFARYANGIAGSEKFMDREIMEAPEIVIPADAPAPEFVPPCGKEVMDLYNEIWSGLKK
jgi:spermidine/putrescine transport system substrate-binding protein